MCRVRSPKVRWKKLEGILYILPYLLFWGAFVAYPVGYGIYLSLMDWHPLRGSRFVGLANYAALFQDTRFLNALSNSFKFSGLVVPLILLLALAFALLLWRWRGDKCLGILAQSVFFFPYLLTVSVVAITWRWLMDPDFGLVTAVFRALRITAPTFLADPGWALPTVAVATAWWLTGYRMVVFQAALGDIPTELFESAVIDGAGFVQQFRHIILPLIKPSLLFALVLTIISAFRTFGQVLMMTEGGPGRTTEVLALYLYWNAFEYFRIGRAAAAGVVMLGLTLGLTILGVKLLGLRSELE
ncbi:MAG: sugar ABC transporter permease [Candidatus Methanomethyliaceae archaeon]